MRSSNDVADARRDPIEAFYDQRPYPPPVAEVHAGPSRAAHHLIWPERPPDTVGSVLIAGCGTAQAVRYALRRPRARVVGIDVSATSLEHSRELAAAHGVANLELHRLPIEQVAELGERFDHIVCTGVLHHLDDPALGLRCLREVLAARGAVTLMVYAHYGRLGVSLIRDYCRRLGVGTSDDDLADLRATLREIPLGHPLGRLLRESRDVADDDALADALCNPRERTYTVPELMHLLEGAGLRFSRWERQAPYLPDCGAISTTPHARRIAQRPPAEQHALTELFRGTMTRHTAIAFTAEDPVSGVLDFADHTTELWVPVPVPTAIAVEQRLPEGAAAALINRAHTETDLVLLVGRAEYDIFRSIDGRRPIAELGPGAIGFVERLWRHDLVAVDTTAAGAVRRTEEER